MTNRQWGVVVWASWWSAWLALTGCSGGSDGSDHLHDEGPRMGGAPEGPPGGGSAGSGDSTDDGVPEEEEVPARFEQPAAGARYVYVANPAHSSIAVIDAETFSIELAEAGDEPRYLTTLGGRDVAVVLNVASQDASVLRTTASGTRTSIVPVVAGANAIAVAPGGGHAVVYHDTAQPAGRPSTASLQDVSVLAFDEDGDRAIDVSVGFGPRQVTFNDDGTRGFVVTEDGVSILDFAAIEDEGSVIAPLVTLGVSTLAPSVDVSVTPDGAYALARQAGASVVQLVALEDGAVTTLDLMASSAGQGSLDGGMPAAEGDAGAPQLDPPGMGVTDLDVSPTGEFAVAALRDQNALLYIPIPGGFEDPATVRRVDVEDVVVGSVSLSPGGRLALAYTTAFDDEHVAIVDLEGETPPRPIRLRKAIEAVAITPDGASALLIHTKHAGSPDEPGLDREDQIDRSFGYTLLALERGYAKLHLTPAKVGPFAITPENDHLFLLFGDEAASPPVREVHIADLQSFQVRNLKLGAAPRSVGIVPGPKQAFVGQEQAEGRITFVDWTTAEEQTFAGFELNSRIRN